VAVGAVVQKLCKGKVGVAAHGVPHIC
jgi:hypothetical protein